jgi:vesicle-associated membrane protein 4
MSEPVDNRTNKLSSLRADVNETTKVLLTTVDKLAERGDRLDVLSARAEELNMSSGHFHGSARTIQRRMKWRSYKMTIIISKYHFLID